MAWRWPSPGWWRSTISRPKAPEHPQPAVNGRLGRAFARVAASTLADAWIAAADALTQGKTMAEAQAALQQNWQAARAKAFVATVAPEFAKVIAEATEPKDAAQRAEVVRSGATSPAG